jgi:transcription antitermination factor NusG
MSIEAELITKYGRDILTVRKQDVPPRRASDKHMLPVIPKAGQRRKLQAELRRDGFKAHVPRHRVDKDTPANIVFTNALPAFAKHARDVLRQIPTREVLKLYGSRPLASHSVPDAYAEGDHVRIDKGPFASFFGVVVCRVKKGWDVDVNIFGRICRVTMATHSMRKHDPG